MTQNDTNERIERIQQGLSRWFRTRRSDLDGLDISNLRAPEVGASNETLFFDLQWKISGKVERQSLVIRLKPMSGPQVFQEYDLSFQYGIMNMLADTNVPVPRLLGYEEDESILGAPFFLMERIEGKVPIENPLYHVEGWIVDLTPEQRAEMWDSGIQVFSCLHRLDLEKMDLEFLNQPQRGNTPLDQQLHYYKEFFEWTMEGRQHPLCEEALRWLEANKPKGPEPVALCWGDAKLGNMVFQGTRCVGLLDWELAGLGNPLDDIVWYILLDRSLSEGCDVPRLEGFPGREETVARWEELSGMKAENLGYYEVLGAFKFSVIMCRIMTIYKQLGFWPADSDWDINNNATKILEKEMALRR